MCIDFLLMAADKDNSVVVGRSGFTIGVPRNNCTVRGFSVKKSRASPTRVGLAIASFTQKTSLQSLPRYKSITGSKL